MKRLIWATVLSFLLVAILIFGNFVVKTNCQILLDAVQECKTTQDKNSALQKAENLENMWVKKERRMAIFVNRNIVQEIGLHIALIKQTAAEPDSLDYLAACRETEILITHALKNQRFSI